MYQPRFYGHGPVASRSRRSVRAKPRHQKRPGLCARTAGETRVPLHEEESGAIAVIPDAEIARMCQTRTYVGGGVRGRVRGIDLLSLAEHRSLKARRVAS